MWAPRAQCDKKAYQFRMKAVLERTRGLEVKTSHRYEYLHECDRESATGVETDIGHGRPGSAVVVTSGTFCEGCCMLARMAAWRSDGGHKLRTRASRCGSWGSRSEQFQTGTPCRISSRSRSILRGAKNSLEMSRHLDVASCRCPSPATTTPPR